MPPPAVEAQADGGQQEAQPPQEQAPIEQQPAAGGGEAGPPVDVAQAVAQAQAVAAKLMAQAEQVGRTYLVRLHRPASLPGCGKLPHWQPAPDGLLSCPAGRGRRLSRAQQQAAA